MSAESRPFNIRPATLTDVDRLCEFTEEFALRTQSRPAGRSQNAFEKIIEGDSGILQVADHGTGISGYAYASYRWRPEFSGETMDIVELFVEQAWRHKGVGAGLIAALLDNAKQRGIRRLSAEVHPGNATIERMLEKAGFDPEHRTIWGLGI